MCRRCLSLVIASGVRLKGAERLLEIGSQDESILNYLVGAHVGMRASVDLRYGSGDTAEGGAPKGSDAGSEGPSGRLKLAYPDESFDLVVSSCPIYRVGDLRQYFQEVGRVLAQKGKLIVVMQPSEACEDVLLALRLVQKQYPKLFKGSVDHAAGFSVRTKAEIIDSIRSNGFLVTDDSRLRYRERFTPQSYASHVAAMAGDGYLEGVPTYLREDVRTVFAREASRLYGPGPTVKDCAMIVFATKAGP
jgi:SAM-dependent methyltransferase